MDCDYGALDNERAYLVNEFNAINSSVDTFIKISQDICKSDVWTSEVEETYNSLISGIVDNYVTITEQFANIDSYMSTVVENYYLIDHKLMGIQ